MRFVAQIDAFVPLDDFIRRFVAFLCRIGVFARHLVAFRAE